MALTAGSSIVWKALGHSVICNVPHMLLFPFKKASWNFGDAYQDNIESSIDHTKISKTLQTLLPWLIWLCLVINYLQYHFRLLKPSNEFLQSFQPTGRICGVIHIANMAFILPLNSAGFKWWVKQMRYKSSWSSKSGEWLGHSWRESRLGNTEEKRERNSCHRR